MAPTDISLDEQFVGGVPMFTLSKSHTKEEQDFRRFKKINHAGTSDIYVWEIWKKEWNIMNVVFFIFLSKVYNLYKTWDKETLYFKRLFFQFTSQLLTNFYFTRNTQRSSRCPDQQKNVIVWSVGWYFNHMTYSTFTNGKMV